MMHILALQKNCHFRGYFQSVPALARTGRSILHSVEILGRKGHERESSLIISSAGKLQSDSYAAKFVYFTLPECVNFSVVQKILHGTAVFIKCEILNENFFENFCSSYSFNWSLLSTQLIASISRNVVYLNEFFTCWR